MKMEVDSKQLGQILKLLKSFEHELLAYRLLYEFVRDSEKFPLAELVGHLKQAKEVLQQEMNEKYDATIQTLSSTTDQASAFSALEFLSKWIPKGKPN